MNFLDRLERKFGKLAIQGLIKYIVGLNVFVYILFLVDPSIINNLALNPQLVMRGEVWRLITYIFIPRIASPIWMFFVFYIAYLIGTSLEREWGSFRFNLYYLLGMIGITTITFITGATATAEYLHISLFLAFATMFPEHQFLLFFILPVKVKYLGWLSWGMIILTVITSTMPFALIPLVSVINFFIFFGKDIILRSKNRRKVHHNRKRFETNIPRDFTIHKCRICGITEKDNPKMDFRYCVDCEGNREYCMEHLHNHEHVRE